jgi:hypothetical protein
MRIFGISLPPIIQKKRQLTLTEEDRQSAEALKNQILETAQTQGLQAAYLVFRELPNLQRDLLEGAFGNLHHPKSPFYEIIPTNVRD